MQPQQPQLNPMGGYGQPPPNPMNFGGNVGYQSPQTGPAGQPIIQQPMNFYPPPMAQQQHVPFGPYSDPSVPRGLEILLTLNQLIIEQQVEMLEGKKFLFDIM
ncbi:hypothetical protein BLA29_013760 [Euroglyphus maynei]|uniref:Uncharacterized protein n=1 Tax=Euroglyphus maynei TaxID=6958 RepID=A0A1Y3BUW1_EURMA|nr:hypothetical protein BLA29_013760 [Euroglyphus maynei]